MPQFTIKTGTYDCDVGMTSFGISKEDRDKDFLIVIFGSETYGNLEKFTT